MFVGPVQGLGTTALASGGFGADMPNRPAEIITPFIYRGGGGGGWRSPRQVSPPPSVREESPWLDECKWQKMLQQAKAGQQDGQTRRIVESVRDGAAVVLGRKLLRSVVNDIVVKRNPKRK